MKLAQTTTSLDGDSASDTHRREVGVRISIQTILLVAATVVVIAALASIRSVLLVIFVSIFSVAVLSPAATAMERRFGWSRRVCSMVLVLAIVIVVAAVALVMAQAISDAVRGLSHDPTASSSPSSAEHGRAAR